MQEKQIDIQRYEDDEIDLKELAKTLWTNRMKIIVITSVITALAVVYALTVPKVYEAKAIVKIGEYKLNNIVIVHNNNNNGDNGDNGSSVRNNGNGNKKVAIANASELTKELEVLYIEVLKNKKDRPAMIESIALVKKQKNLFEIVANGNSNKTATAELMKVVEYVQKKHQKLLDDVRELREAQIKDVKSRLSLIEEKTLPALKSRISRYQDDVTIYEQNFKDVQENLKKIKKIDPTMAALQINEQSYLAKMLMKLRDSLEGYREKKENIIFIKLPELQKNLNILYSSMKPYNYKNTAIIGNIMTNDYPIKPKKKLIVIVAFITGFILSIFLVFFLEFLKGFKKEDFEE